MKSVPLCCFLLFILHFSKTFHFTFLPVETLQDFFTTVFHYHTARKMVLLLTENQHETVYDTKSSTDVLIETVFISKIKLTTVGFSEFSPTFANK